MAMNAQPPMNPNPPNHSDASIAAREKRRAAGKARRFVVAGVVCLLLGVTTSIAVAWGLSLWIHWRISPSLTGGTSQQAAVLDVEGGWVLHVLVTPEERSAIWKVMGLRDPGPYGHATVRYAEQLRAMGGEDAYERVSVRPNTIALEAVHGGLPGWIPREGLGESFTWAMEFRSGWPFGCLAGRGIARETPSGTVFEREVFVTVPAREPFPAAIQRARLPIVPLWPALIVNTLTWGALWFGVLVGFSAARRWRRVRRGRCAWCGYDLKGLSDRGSGVCPECGRA